VQFDVHATNVIHIHTYTHTHTHTWCIGVLRRDKNRRFSEWSACSEGQEGQEEDPRATVSLSQ